MVDAHDVHHLVELLEALLPPGVVLGLHGLPVVLRIAPELSRRAEIVRRYARNRMGRAIRVEVEELLVRPDIGAVLCEKDRHVAHDADALLLRVVVQALPLAVEKVLHELL